MKYETKSFDKAVRAELTRAGEMYGLEDQMAKVTIAIDIKGFRCAGQACWDTKRQYRIRFHPEYVENHYAQMVKETIPHEVAHIVCMMRPELGKNHDSGWRKVFNTLGCGLIPIERCHNMSIQGAVSSSGRKVKANEVYVTNAGVRVELTPIRHGKLQRGTVEWYEFRGEGKIFAADHVGTAGQV